MADPERAREDLGLEDTPEQYTQQDFYDDLMEVSDGRANDELCTELVENAYEAMNWLTEHGIGWHIVDHSDEPGFGTTVGAVQADGEGLGVIEDLTDRIDELGIDVHYDTEFRGIETDEKNEVTAAKAVGPSGKVTYEAHSIVICAGSYVSNPEKRTRYFGRDGEGYVVRGSRYNTGEALDAAMDAGAYPAGQWGGGHQVMNDATAAEVEEGRARINGYQYSVTLNREGDRFIDEGEDFLLKTYAKFGQRLYDQPKQRGFVVFDSTVDDLVVSQIDTEPIEADTLEALFEKVGIVDVENALETMDAFNDATTASADEFDPHELDGNATEGRPRQDELGDSRRRAAVQVFPRPERDDLRLRRPEDHDREPGARHAPEADSRTVGGRQQHGRVLLRKLPRRLCALARGDVRATGRPKRGRPRANSRQPRQVWRTDDVEKSGPATGPDRRPPRSRRHQQGVFRHRTGVPRGRGRTARHAPPGSVRLAGSLQIDGIGGSISSTSKFMLVGASDRDGVDVDYTFGQVAVNQPAVDWSGNCGNLTSAIGTFALKENLVAADGDPTTVTLYNTNTDTRIEQSIPTEDGYQHRTATTPSTASPERARASTRSSSTRPAASSAHCRRLETFGTPLPSRARSTRCRWSTRPTPVFVRAADLGLTGTELPSELEGQPDVLETLELIRGSVCERLGLVENAADARSERPTIPFIAFVSEPQSYEDSLGGNVDAADIDVTARVITTRPHITPTR